MSSSVADSRKRAREKERRKRVEQREANVRIKEMRKRGEDAMREMDK